MKKIILTLVCALPFMELYAQSVTIEPGYSRFDQDSTHTVQINTNSDSPLLLSTNGPVMYLRFNTYESLLQKDEGSIRAGFGGLGINGYNYLSLGTRGYSIFKINELGKISIGTSTRPSELSIYGYSKLGNEAPAIKMKKITGRTPTTSSGVVSFSHGITPSKILGVQFLIEYAANAYVPNAYTISDGYTVDYYISGDYVYVRTKSGTGSSYVLNKPFKILITYEE